VLDADEFSFACLSWPFAMARPAMAAFLFLCLTAAPRLCAPFSWDGGATTGNWAHSSNWNPNGIPTPGANLTFNAANANGEYVVTLQNTDRTAGSMTFANAGGTNGFTFSAGTGTLNLGGFSSTFGTLSVTARSTIAFSETPVLTVNSLSIASGATLTIQNWADGIDYFYSSTNPGVVLGRGVFNGYSAAATRWQFFDSEVTPVPEPSTYGTVFTFFGHCVVAWRRLHNRSPVSAGM
jgi:hypothetical protein